MRSRRILFLLPLLLAGLLISTALPASAAGKTVEDPRGEPGTPSHIDLTKVRYVNGSKVIRFRAHVVDLRQTGSFWFKMKRPLTDDRPWFVARVTNRGVRLGRFGAQGLDFGGCRGLRSTWQPGLNVVTATIPHACLRAFDFGHALRLSLQSVNARGDLSDDAPGKTVRRG
jgi:hypothetical protein